MSRRVRAAGFTAAAGLCAAVAAAASGGPSGQSGSLGPLREVVVAVHELPAGRPLSRALARDALELRRVPARFVAPDALANPAQALGRRPVAPIPAGGYLLASQFAAAAERGGGDRPRLPGGRRPVELAVSGSGALLAAGRPARVDVVVTTEPRGVGAGRTFVAAEDVRLLALVAVDEHAIDAAASPGSGTATLALTRTEALRLIHAQSYAREVRLIGA